MTSGAQRTLLKLVILVWWAILPPKAYGQDVELTEVAQALLGKLEAAKQTSGTVLDFSDLQGSPTELGRYLAQELSDRMVSESNGFGLVDRANLQYLLRENKLSAEGLVNPKTTRKLGQLIGVDTVILGTTTPLGDSIRLSVRAIDVETGKIVASQTATLPATTGLRTLFNRSVAAAPAAARSSQSALPLPLHQLLREGALKVEVRDFAMERGGKIVGMSYLVENLSGTSLQISLKINQSQIGLCNMEDGYRGFRATGIASPRSWEDSKTWLNTGQVVHASLTNMGYCDNGRISLGQPNDLMLTFLLVRDDEEIEKVVTIPNVRIREVKQRY